MKQINILNLSQSSLSSEAFLMIETARRVKSHKFAGQRICTDACFLRQPAGRGTWKCRVNPLLVARHF